MGCKKKDVLEEEKKEKEKKINNNNEEELDLFSDKDLASIMIQNNTNLMSNSNSNDTSTSTNETKNEEYNDEYKYELNQEKLTNKLMEEKDPDLRDFFLHQLEQINEEPDLFTNKGLLFYLKTLYLGEFKTLVIKKFKKNVLFIQKKINILIQSMIDKLSTVPYTIRCICKIIYLLISKKFPLLPKYFINSFVGEFLFNKYIFPSLSLENKNITETRIFSTSTKNCLNIIISIITRAYKCLLYSTQVDTEKTIFNYYLIEIIPILNKFFDKLIDIELPKVLKSLMDKYEPNVREGIVEKMTCGQKEKENQPEIITSNGKNRNVQEIINIYN